MAKTKTKTKVVYDINTVFKDIASGISGISVFLLLVIFPLYTHDAYFDILGARYVFFKLIVIVMMILMTLLAIIYLLIDNKHSTFNPNGGAFDRLANSLRPENLKKHIIITDVFFTVMIFSAALSTRNSNFPSEAFYGNAGRYQGLECWLLYFMLYIMISRTFKYNRIYVDFALVAGTFACVWGFTDFIYLDLFNFFTNVASYQRVMFTSSVGNLDTYTNYTIIIFALSATLFMMEKNPLKAVFYGLCAYISVMGSIFGLADNTVVAIGIFFVVAPFVALKDKRAIVRYFYLISIFAFSISCFKYVRNLPFSQNSMDSFFRQISEIQFIRLLWIPFAIVGIALNVLFRKRKINDNLVIVTSSVLDEECPKFIKRIWLVLLLVGTVSLVLIVVDMNVTKLYTNIWTQIPSSYQLMINDDWGTHRGHNWRIAFTNFIERFNWFQRFFGYGPETYLIVTERTFYTEMVERYGEVYDSAHNEYIHYLICFGMVGLVSYLGIFISGIRYALKTIKDNEEMAAISMAVICYMAQATVNIAIPITTPVFFTLMYIGVAHYLENKKLVEIPTS